VLLPPDISKGVLGHDSLQGVGANMAGAVKGKSGTRGVHAIRRIEDAVEIAAQQDGTTISRKRRAELVSEEPSAISWLRGSVGPD
jgi:hypothetical protein